MTEVFLLIYVAMNQVAPVETSSHLIFMKTKGINI